MRASRYRRWMLATYDVGVASSLTLACWNYGYGACVPVDKGPKGSHGGKNGFGFAEGQSSASVSETGR